MTLSQNNLYHLIRRLRRYLGRGVRSARDRLACLLGQPGSDYERWLGRQSATIDLAKLDAGINNLNSPPQFILVCALGHGEEPGALRMLASIFAQNYTSWRLVLIQTSPWEPSFQEQVLKLRAEGRRLSVIDFLENQVNQALEQTPGDWVAWVRSGDSLLPAALAETALFLDQYPDTGLVYSDEDLIDERGKRSSPYFKPDWSPDLLLGHNYIGQLAVYKKELLIAAGGLSGAIGLAERYALFLRLAEIGIWIRHIPKVLYSRGAPDQPRGSETEGEYRALAEALQKRGRLTDIERVAGFPGYFRVHWRLSGAPLVSIMICTKDKADFLQKCLVSVFERSEYQNFEVILVDNQSKEEKTFDLIKCWKEKEPSRFRRLAIDEPFNFSALNNRAAKSANGELLLFLNNDTEVISSSWLQELAGQALRPEIGAVGALLLFQDGSIQHAGIIVGGEKIAVHADRGASGDEPGYHGRLLIPGNVSAVSAACLMVRKDVFWHAGGFDEGLPRGYNDVALCLQLRRLRYSHVFLPQVKLFHHESQTRGYPIFPRGQDRLQKEKEYMIEHFPELQHPDPYHNPNLELFSENIR